MEPVVSVIVPVFRVEQYLGECMDSLLHQTLAYIEIILVDDGSDDHCPALCDEYGAKYRQVKVIHQQNSGLSSARNAGMALARGKYAAFCDSDDMMKPEMLEKMVKAAEENAADIVICGYNTFPSGKTFLPGFLSGCALSPDGLLRSCSTVHSGNELCFTWRFLFRTEYLRKNQLSFDPAIRIGEDFIFNAEAVMTAQKIFVLDESLYLYRIRDNSIMRQKYKPDLEALLELQYEKKLEISRKYGLDKNDDYMSDLAYYYITGFAGMLFRNAMNGPLGSQRSAVKRAIRLPMLAENYGRCGKKLYQSGKKNAIFRLACKHKIDFLVFWLIKKWYV